MLRPNPWEQAGTICLGEINPVFNPQKDARASPQVNGKDPELSRRRCSALYWNVWRLSVWNMICYRGAAAGNLSNTTAASQTGSAPVINGLQPAAHQNGVQDNVQKAEFEEMVHGNPTQTQPILAFEAGEPFLMKTGAMKPQHVAGSPLKEFGSGQMYC